MVGQSLQHTKWKKVWPKNFITRTFELEMQQILHTCGKVRDSNTNEPSFKMVQSPVFQPFIFTVTHKSKYTSYYIETQERSTSILKGLPRNIYYYYERHTVLLLPLHSFVSHILRHTGHDWLNRFYSVMNGSQPKVWKTIY